MLSTRPIALNSDVDIASQPVLHAKTPGRKLKNRAALQENAIIHSGAKTVLSKKNVLQTPFRPGTAHGKKQLVSVSMTRPLMDKTPFPNRVSPATGFGASKTPATKGLKLSKLSLLVPEPEQPELLTSDAAPLLRPSSTRKSLRGRLSGTFKTPVTKGDHWNVSPGDMELDIAGGTTEQATEQVVSPEDEDDEIEYMPPTAVEPPYEPPFELPDYKSMGTTLFTLGHAPLQDDTLDVFYARSIEEQLDVHVLIAESGPQSVDSLELPELKDDSPFAKKAVKPGPAVGSSKPPATRIPSSRAASVAATRSQIAQKPATTMAPSRATARAPSSSSSAPKPGPAPTRTSVLRAAKAAAASNSVTTPQPARPATASVTARPASAVPLRRAVSTTAATKPAAARPVASTSTVKPTASAAAPGPGNRGRPATSTSTTVGRTRSATVSVPPARAGASRVAAPAKPAAVVTDPLADILEQKVGGDLDDDFQFAV
ncbi:hypothetical protein PYCCODRAFT_1462302 [Trametes coccinea BRFM310]|uniref:Uncharacterized protein n=1 Tax=Trametes coccinea (strain BRFM310) TaxID=1353009 RepID=A0A1Y2I6K1_TRAC3|nr:hypothetical protein PYCCODRAFT_1462302 [Trametes coccinea BRFM310]